MENVSLAALLLIHGNIILGEIGAGSIFFSVLQLVGPWGGGELGVLLNLELSAPFVVAQRRNPLWGLTITPDRTHTNLPPGPGVTPCASVVGNQESSGMYKAEASCQPHVTPSASSP